LSRSTPSWRWIDRERALAETVYHVELRQFPHNMCRFNLSGSELRATILEPWAQGRLVEFGERKWVPGQAKLTVLEGPRIPFGQLTMGRGWRAAQHDGREVTDELLAALARETELAREAAAEVGGAAASASAAAVPVGAPGATGEVRAERPAGASSEVAAGRAPSASSGARRAEDLAADSLGLELLARIGPEPAPLRVAWELAGERHSGSPPSATLALAERAVESLLRAGLLVLLGAHAGEPGEAGEARQEEGERVAPAAGGRALDASEAGRAIAAIASWSDAGGGLWMRRV
jgi:hypothetical protein